MSFDRKWWWLRPGNESSRCKADVIGEVAPGRRCRNMATEKHGYCKVHRRLLGPPRKAEMKIFELQFKGHKAVVVALNDEIAFEMVKQDPGFAHIERAFVRLLGTASDDVLPSVICVELPAENCG